MRKRTTQLSVLLSALAFSSMASPVFSGENLRDSFTVIITTHLDMIARSNESYFLDRPIYRCSNNGIAGDGDAVDHNSTRSNNGIVGDGGGATEQIGGVGSDYQGARGGEGSGDHGDITGAIRVTQHHDWIVQQINDGGDDVVNILTTKIPNSAGPQINDGDAVDHNSTRSNRGIVDEGRGGGGTDMDVLGRRWRGDANRDGVVTGTDLIVVQQNFGMAAALDGFLDGDANGDGQVTGMDLIEVQQTFGQVEDWGDDVVNILTSKIPNGTGQQINDSTDRAVVAAVPEPATIALISAGLLFMRKTRRTR